MLTRVVFLQLGIEEIHLNGLTHDPTTEEEFDVITYDSQTRVTWDDFLAFFTSIRTQTMLYALRMFRDEELKHTDWVMTYDNTQTLQNIDEWIVYRQYLRDLPTVTLEYKYTSENTPDVLNMDIPKRPNVIRKQNQ